MNPELLAQLEQEHGLPAGLLPAVIKIESGGNPNAVSPKGAVGIAQFMPKTAAELGIDPRDPVQSVKGAAQMYARLLKQYGGDLDKALAGYNWGEGRVNRLGLEKMPAETRVYIQKVKANMQRDPWEVDDTQQAKGADPWEIDDTPAAKGERTPAAAAPKESPNAAVAAGAGLAKGVADPLQSAAYLIPRTGQFLTSLGGYAPNPLSRTYEALAKRIGEGNRGLDELYEQNYGDSGFATAGRIGGNVLAGLPFGGPAKTLSTAWETGAFPAVLKSLAGYTGIGATQGVLADTHSEQDLSKAPANAGWGAAGGAFGALLGPVISGGGRLVSSLVEPFTGKGQQRIAARAIDDFAADRAAVRAAATAPHPVPGYQPTLAEAARDPGVAQLQRAAQSSSPQVANAIDQRAVANNRALTTELQKIAGDAAERDVAEFNRKVVTAPLRDQIKSSTAAADPTRVVKLIDRIVDANPGRDPIKQSLSKIREDLFEPYPLEQKAADAWGHLNDLVKQSPRMSAADFDAVRQARLIASRVKSGSLDVAEGSAQLGELTAKSKTATDAITKAQAFLDAPGHVLRTDPDALYSVRKGIADAMEKRGEGGSRVNEAAMRELATVMKALDHQIAKAEPAYKQYLTEYAKESKPIDRMKVGQHLLDKTRLDTVDLVATGEPRLSAARLNHAMRDERRLVRDATGFKRGSLDDILSPQDRSSIANVRDALSTRAAVESAARVSGSPTGQYLAAQNVLKRTLGPLGLAGLADTKAMPTALRGPAWLLKGQGPAIEEQLSEMLLNPALYAQVTQQPQGAFARLGGHLAAPRYLPLVTGPSAAVLAAENE